MQQQLNEIKRIAREAGAILLSYYSNLPTVEWKAPGDPVTAADRSASALIVRNLKRLFPGDAILCEEEPDDRTRLTRSRVWMVDPMDGTNEFIAHRSEFAVMIGLAVDGVPTAGVVYQPTTDKLYHAAAQLGAFLERNGETRRLQVLPERLASRITIALSRSHKSARVERIRERMRIPRFIQSGSVGLKVGLICEGLAHVYIHTGHRTHVWDTCAPEAILREAGGCMTDVSNSPLRYNTSEVRNLNGVIASNGLIHERAVRATQAVLAAVERRD
jgi:3'(2'), 5'-bisphosphate nucleotidase